MRYYNNTKKSYMPFIGDEPTIIDDNTGDVRELKINCIRFFVGNNTSKVKGDQFIIKHTDSITGILNNWFSCNIDRTLVGLTTFVKAKAIRTTPIVVTPSIISGSYSYDGEQESFKIPLLSPIYSNDSIKCSMSGKTSNRNALTIDPNVGTIEVSREV